MRGPAAWADKKIEASYLCWHHLPLIWTSVKRRPDKWSVSAWKITHSQRITFSLVPVLLAWCFDLVRLRSPLVAQHKSKSTKRSRLSKNGWKQARVLAGRNEGCYNLPLLKTDVQKSPVHRQPSSQAFLLYFFAACFLYAIFGRPVLSQLIFNSFVKQLPRTISPLEMVTSQP